MFQPLADCFVVVVVAIIFTIIFTILVIIKGNGGRKRYQGAGQ